MVRLNAIRSLSDFQRNTRKHLKRLKQTGEPEVLTVNGQAELVVQSADSYQRLLDAADLSDSVRTLRTRLTGKDAIPLEQFDAEMRRKHGITRRSRRSA